MAYAEHTLLDIVISDSYFEFLLSRRSNMNRVIMFLFNKYLKLGE